MRWHLSCEYARHQIAMRVKKKFQIESWLAVEFGTIFYFEWSTMNLKQNQIHLNSSPTKATRDQ